MAASCPPVSVVIPTYQRRDLVCEAVTCLERQEYPGPLQLVVVVDGSTDGTAAALRALDLRFPLILVEQDNRGLASARNAGARAATGEILLFLDDDMFAWPDLVRRHVESHSQGAVAVVGQIPLDEGSPSGFLTRGVAAWSRDWAEEAANLPQLTAFNVIGGQVSVRRDLFWQLGGFDEAFARAGTYGKEDADFGARLLAHGRVVYNPQAISTHRYVVSPGEYMQRGFETGRADVALARKHPQLAPELRARAAASSPWFDTLLKALACLPLLAPLSHMVVARLADRKVETGSAGGLLARLTFAQRRLNYWRGVRAAGGWPDSRKALILCYHAVRDDFGCQVMRHYNMPPGEFARQMDGLAKRGFHFVSPQQVLAMLQGKATLPKKSVLVTFDDGYRELEKVARDILQPRGIPAAVFAVTGIASLSNEWDQAIGAQRLELMDAARLATLASLGIELGSHSRRHTALPGLAADRLADEVAGSARDMVTAGHSQPTLFAYPYGAHDAASRAAVQAAGYTAAMCLAEQYARPDCDLYCIPRVEILRRDTGWRFWLKTTFPYASRVLRWREIARNRWRRLVGILAPRPTPVSRPMR